MKFKIAFLSILASFAIAYYSQAQVVVCGSYNAPIPDPTQAYTVSDMNCGVVNQPYNGTFNMKVNKEFNYQGSVVYVCKVSFNSISSTSSNNYQLVQIAYNSNSYGLGQEIALNPANPYNDICVQLSSQITQVSIDSLSPTMIFKASFTSNCATTFTIPSSALDSNYFVQVQTFNTQFECNSPNSIITYLEYPNVLTGIPDTVNCGTAYIYSYSANPATPLVLVDSISISNMSGFYYSPPNNSTKYTALYVPCDSIVLEKGLMPTYFSSTPLWSEADTLGVGISNQNTLSIISDTSLVSGFAGIEGYIFDGKADKAPGVPNVSVFLKNQAGQVLKFNKTNSDGKYFFENLPYGTYFIYPDVPSVNVMPYEITLSAGDTVDISADFMYSGNEIAPIINTSSINNYDILEIKIAPNPAQDFVNITFPANKASLMTIKIVDLSGKTVLQHKQSVDKNATTFSLSLSQIPAGMYMITIVGNTYHGRQKLIVAH